MRGGIRDGIGDGGLVAIQVDIDDVEDGVVVDGSNAILKGTERCGHVVEQGRGVWERKRRRRFVVEARTSTAEVTQADVAEAPSPDDVVSDPDLAGSIDVG